MSRVYWHNVPLSNYEKENVLEIMDVLEIYLCDYKLGFHCIYQTKKGHKYLTRLDIMKMGSKSVIASYSFSFKTLSLFHRKQYQGSIKLDDILEEIEKRGC